MMTEHQWYNSYTHWLACGLTVFAGLTMVSNVRFYSFKDINLRRSVPFTAMLILVMAFALVASDPARVLFAIFLLYACSGYVAALGNWMRKRRERKRT